MSGMVRGIFGGRTKAQKRAEAMQADALQSQKRAQRAAQEDAALVRGEQAASGRRLRGLGRRALAFMGSELGVTESLSGVG